MSLRSMPCPPRPPYGPGDRPTRLRVALSFLTTTTLAACSDELDRSEAGDKLRASSLVAKSAFRLPVAKVSAYGEPCDRLRPAAAPLSDWTLLRAAGIGLTTRDTTSRGWTPRPFCVARLTAEGQAKATAAGWREEVRSDPIWGGQPIPIWLVPVADRRVTDVTGVSAGDEAGGTARAEFVWAWAPRPIMRGTPMQAHFDTLTATGVAEFRKYDDGWRVISVDFGGGDGTVDAAAPTTPARQPWMPALP